MARGWESKAVADQIDEADQRALQQESLDDLSPEERTRRERLESLRLSRAHTLTQLERATRPAHRQMLQRTLRALEAEMEELS
jgi:LPS O-antigen subunit length determinant protein (WzzB/FepE family)